MTRTWPGQIPIESVYTAGIGGQLFFSALKERGALVGTRCGPCAQVYVPARSFCERCFGELSEEVTLPPHGRLKSFTVCYIDHDGNRLKQPSVLGLMQLEGATTVLLHRLLGVDDPAQVQIGSRVEVVIKPKKKRTGSILDIEGFKLV
jgi:uncharacterized OB-fold protein